MSESPDWLAAFSLAAPRDSASPAITDASGTVGYGRLAELMESVRSSLRRSSAVGGLIGIEMASSAQSVAGFLACAAEDQTVLLLPPNLPRDERRVILENSGMRCLLEWPTGATSWQLTPISQPPMPSLPPGIVQLTSGSLGPSRLALRTWHALDLEIEALRQRLRLGRDDSTVCASSIAHSYGLIGGLLVSLAERAHVTLSGPDAQSVPPTLRPVIVMGLARTYQSLLARDDLLTLLRGARALFSAGAPLPPALFEEFQMRTGLPIRQDYGTTETGTISLDDEPLARPDTVGRPLEHMELRVSSGQRADERGSGEVQVRSPAIASGYLWDRTLRSAAGEDGWYHTRDRGSFDGSYLRLGSRIRTPLRVPSGAIEPAEIEEAIVGIPGIREALVLPLEGQPAPGFRIVVATDLDRPAVQTRVASILPSLLRPARIDIVDELPRSPAGKVLQKYLV